MRKKQDSKNDRSTIPSSLFTVVCPAPAAWSTATWGTVSAGNAISSRSATSSPHRSSRLLSAHALAIAVVVSAPYVIFFTPVTAMLRVEAVHRVEPTTHRSERQVCTME